MEIVAPEDEGLEAYGSLHPCGEDDDPPRLLDDSRDQTQHMETQRHRKGE